MNRSKITFLATCMLSLAHTSFSQVSVDSLLQHQLNNKLDIISRARAVLIDAFLQNDKQKVQELHRYLSETFEQDNYVALFPAEQVLLFAWYGDFEDMLQYIQKADSAYLAQLRKKITPTSTNNFYQTATERLQQELEVVLGNLQSSPLTQEEKDFAAIYLHYFLITVENVDTAVRKINTDTRAFIAAYPNSEYIKLLNSNEYRLSDWGWGFGLNFGYSAKTGNLSKNFKNDGAVDFYVDAVYKKVMATTGILIAPGSARKDIVSDGLVLPKDTSGSIFNFYLSFGYRFFDDKRIIVTPIAGIGTAWINPGTTNGRKNNPDLKRFDYSYGLTANFGVMADIKLGKMEKVQGQNFTKPPLCIIRVSYKFLYNNLQSAPTFYDGNLHTITAGIVLFGRNIKRVEYK